MSMKISKKIDDLRSLTYSLDARYVGFYLWIAGFSVRIGGTETEDQPYFYPYIVPTFIGFGFALPNYFSWHTPFSEYNLIEQSKMSHNKSDQGFDHHLPNSL